MGNPSEPRRWQTLIAPGVWLLCVAVNIAVHSFWGLAVFAVMGTFWVWAAHDAQRSAGRVLELWKASNDSWLQMWKERGDAPQPE